MREGKGSFSGVRMSEPYHKVGGGPRVEREKT